MFGAYLKGVECWWEEGGLGVGGLAEFEEELLPPPCSAF